MPSVPKITPAVDANHSKMGWRSGCLLAIALVAVVAAHQYIGGSGVSTLAIAGWSPGLPAGSDTTATKSGSAEATAQSTARRLQNGDSGAATGNFTSITIPLDVCGYEVPTPYAQISGEILGTPWKDPESPPSLGFQRSLKTFIEQTSFGTLRVPNNTDQNLVLNKPVPVRGNKICIKSGKNVTVNCSSVDAIADEAEAYAQNVLGIDMTKYAVKIFFLDNKMPGCSSASLARVGCFTNKPGPETPDLLCRTWNFEGTTKLIINLVSYNFGLLQAQLGDGTSTVPDWSSPMTPSGYHVHNAFQSHYLGWTQPIKTLDSKTTKAGNWTSVRLPPRASAAANYVLLTGYGLDLYVSYLAPVGWEKEDTNPDHIYKLLVHRQKSIKDGTRSVLLSVLGAGEQSTLLGSATYPGWVVRMLPGPTLNGTTAQICRAENASQCAPDTGISRPPPSKSKPKPPKRVRSPKPPKPPASNRTGL